MNRSIITTPSNKRVFGACLLSLMTLIAPIASMGAATRRAIVPLSVKNTKATESTPPSLVQPAAAMPAPVPVPAPPPMPAVGPITATKSDSFPDPDGDGKAELGETITYTIGITNTGTDPALGVTFNDNIDANTTFVPGSMHASPIAFDDSYNWVGNTVLDTAARSLPSATANDVAITDSFTVDTQTNAPTTQGGSVTLAANGHFVYTPQLGDGGPGFSDAFNYTIRNSVDNTLAGTGTVTINMPVRVWYLMAGAAGDGRSHTPSGNTATISTAANLASDILYVYFNPSNLNGAITLDPSQTLLGEGVVLVANSITLRPAGSTPTITNTTGNAVTLGGSNLVTGLNISQANNFAIAGNAISGTTNVTGVGITNSTSGGGLTLTNQTGTINFTNSPISGATSGTAVLVNGGNGAINFSNSPLSRTTGRLVDIQNKTGGSVVFNGGSTLTGAAMTTDAIVLRNHTGGASITFSNNVVVTTTNGRGIQADNSTSSFILIMNAAANSISATGGAALDVEDLAATSALAFTSISSTNSSIVPAHGIRVNNTNGSFNFGNTTITGSDNTGVLLTSNASTLTFADLDITPDSGQRGLHATDNSATLTTTSGTITAPNATAVDIDGPAGLTPLSMTLTRVDSSGGTADGISVQDTSGSFSIIGDNTNTALGGNSTGGTIANKSGADGSVTTGIGIYLNNVSNISLRRITINGTNQNHGIRGFRVNNFTLEYCTVNGTNGTHPTFDNYGEGSVMFGDDASVNTNGITGVGTVTSCNFSGGRARNFQVVNTAGTLNRLTITGSTFGLNQSFVDANASLAVEARNAGTILNATVTGSTFTGSPGDAGNFTGQTGTTMDVIFGGTTATRGTAPGNAITNNHPNNNVGGSNLTFATQGVMNFHCLGNTMRDANGSAVTFFKASSGTTLNGFFNNNEIGNSGVAGSGSLTGNGIFVSAAGAGTMSYTITNNLIHRINGNFHISADNTGGSYGANFDIRGNTFDSPGAGNAGAIGMTNGSPGSGDTTNVCAIIGGSAVADKNTLSGFPAATQTIFLGSSGLNNSATHIFNLPGLPASTEAAVEAFVTANNIMGGTLVDAFADAPATFAAFKGNPGCGTPTSMNKFENPNRLNYARNEQGAETDASSSLLSSLSTPYDFASIYARINNLGASVVTTSQDSSLASAQTSVTATTGPHAAPSLSAGIKDAGKALASFVNAVDSLIDPTAYAETKNSRVRSEIATAGISSRDVRLNHAKSRRSPLTNAATSSRALAPMPPLTPLNIGTLPGNKSVTIKFQVTVNTTGLGSATSVSNQGNVTYTDGPGGGVPTDDQPGTAAPNEPTVTPISRLDVQVTKTDGVTSTTPGSDLTYVLTYTNNDHAANGVELTETVPVGTTFKAAGSDTWVGCADGAPAGTVCTINLGNLPRNGVAGFTGTRTFIVTVLNPAPAGQNDIINTATIASDGTYEPDYIPANNTTTDTDTLTAAPDLNISKTDGVLTTTPGSTLTYTINYSNVGTQNATGVVLTETVPVGTTFTTTGSSAWTGVGCVNGAPAGTVCTINVGNLTAGAPAASATFVVVVTNPAAAGLASISNTATIADDGNNGTDPNLANNTTNDTDTLDAAPDLTISKVANVPDVAPGDTIIYTITYTNVGNQNATGVVITETVPTNTTFSTADSAPTVWSCADNSPAGTICTTTIGPVAGGGGTGNVTFGVEVDDPVSLGATQISNTASIADDGGNGVDPTPLNNTTTVITPIIVCNPPPANMTNWWTGDGTPRDIAGGKDGTLNGAGYGTGKVLQGFSFDGIDDYVDVTDVDLPSTFTVDAWINPTNLTNEQAIVNKDSGVDRSYFFNVTNTGALRALVHSGGGNLTEYQTLGGVVTAGSLQHVAVTYDGAAGAGAKMLFYKNGVLVASTVQSGQDAGGTPENVALAARIGRSNDGTSAFIGVIDELEFFSRVLSAAELLAIFNADSGGKCKPPDLRITKTHTDPFVQGSAGNTYTITVHNDGPGTTSGNVNVLDNLPAGLTATSMSGSGWVCTPIPMAGTPGPAALTCTSTAPIASGADFPAITLTVTAGANMASVTNTVTVSGGGQMDTSDDTANDLTNLTPSSDLLSVKVDSPDPVTASQNITYNVTLTNNGPSDAQTVTLTDTVPANTTFVSAVPNTGPTFLCTNPSPGGTGDVSCSIATLASGAVATFTIVVNVNAATAEGTVITNNAVATTTTNDPVPGNNTGTAMTTVNQSDVEITSKTDAPDPVTAGDNLTYTISFKNNSAINGATGVVVTDALPLSLTFVSATVTTGSGWTIADPGVGNNGTVTFSKAVVAASETAVFSLVVKTNPSTGSNPNVTVQYSNTASVTTTSIDTNSANNSKTELTTVQTRADLEITSKTDAPDPVLASQNITYAIDFVNNGPSDAQTVTVTDAVPAGTTFISAQVTTGSGWSVADPGVGNTGNVVFSKTTVPAGQTATFEVVVKVNNNAVEGLTISNTATAASLNTTDPTPANDSKTATTTVNQSDIEITSKTDTPDPVEAGSNITYTVNFKNNSAVNTASNVTVTDAVPTGTTLVSATTASPGWARTDALNAGDTGNIVFSKALVAASETAVFTIVVKVSTSVTSGTIVTNTATAATTSLDTVSANNSATATTTVVVNADLAVTSKTDTPDPVTASQNITYAINFVNNGPSDAQTVTVTDAVPAGTTFVSASVTSGSSWTIPSPPAVGGTGNVVFSKATVAVAETATFEVVVKVNNNAVEGSIITNNAVAAGSTNDPTPGNNTGTATTTVRQSDIEITSKTDTPDPVTAGENITYTVNFKNNSAFNTASNVTVTDAVPTGTTLVSATTASAGWARTDAVPAGGTGNIVFSKALVAVSETATLTIVVKVNANVLSGTTITNTATAATTSIDTNSANNSAGATTTTAASADLQITSKTDAPDPVTAGENITYTINFINNGPSDAQTVTVTDAVPTNTTFVSASVTSGTGWTIPSPPAVGGTGNVVFSKATVAAAETATFQVVVKVNSNTPAATIISNDAVAASATTDPTPANNTGNATTTVVTSSDLLVVKVDSPDPVVVGQNLTYTITVTNGGASDAQNLSLSDTLPANTTFVSFTVPAGWTRTDAVPVGGTGTVTATAPTLISGASAVFTLVVNVNAATPHNTVLTNSATATSTTTDPNPVNNTGTVMTTVVSQPDLTISKSHAGNFAQGQVGATYTITVNNIGTGPTNGSLVTVTDSVPVGLTPTGPVGAHNGWTCAINGQTLTCTRSDVLAGNSSYPSITLTVNVANPAPATVTNTATVSGGGEVNTSNNSASDGTNIDCTSDFTLNNTNPLMISRFRMNGPAGTQDEFVEIFNPTTTDHTVASGNCGGGGYGVFASAGNGTNSNNVSMVCFIPNGTVIPAGGYYLCTGATYSLSNLGRNGGAEGATSVSDAPIGCGGSCVNDIPNDAGLGLMNVAQGVTLTPGGGFLGGVPDAGFFLYDKVGFGPYGAGAPAPLYPSLAGNFCEGGACLKPVGDASTSGTCSNPSGLFPVVSVPPACYGLAGQYELLRRQNAFDPNLGTVHLDTNNSANDWILVAPNSAINMGIGVTGILGVTAIHGAAGPQGSTAPADTPSSSLKQGPFGSGSTQLSAPNAERNYGLDPTVVDPANNPDGTFALRLRFTNNSGNAISGLRFRVDHISTLCGAQTGTPAVGSGSARNLAASPDCGGGGLKAILKLLNSAQEVVIDNTDTAYAIHGTVIEDLSASATPTPPGAGPLSPKGGGLDNSFIVNPSSNVASVGDGVTGGTGVFATTIGTTDADKVLRIKVKFGVVKSGRFILLFTPAAKPAP